MEIINIENKNRMMSIMKTEKNLKLIIVLFLLLNSFSFGGYKEDLENRMKTVETNISNDNIKTSDMINAENRKYEAWNKEMNTIYKKLLNKIEETRKEYSTDYKNALIKSQKSWLQFRDNEAIFSSMQYKGSSQERLEYIAKKAELTKIRVFKLVEYYDELER